MSCVYLAGINQLLISFMFQCLLRNSKVVYLDKVGGSSRDLWITKGRGGQGDVSSGEEAFVRVGEWRVLLYNASFFVYL